MTNLAKKFVAWDWNGTLLDDTDAVLTCINIGLTSAKCPPITMEQMRDRPPFPRDYFYRAAGLSDEEIAHAMNSERALFHDNYEPLADHASLRQGAAALLRRLKAHNVANFIVSNHIVDQIERMLKRHDIQSCFDSVLAYQSRAVQFKHETKGDKLCRYINDNQLDATNALVVGDTLEEIDIARSLGMASVAITGGVLSEKVLRSKNPDHVVHSIDELDAVLRERSFMP